MSMYKKEEFPRICVTNRHLVEGDYLDQIEEALKQRPVALLLREKDLSEEQYLLLAKEVLTLTDAYRIPLIIHTYPSAAKELGVQRLHLPLPLLKKLSEEEKEFFTTLGASTHSVEEAMEAQKLGATYITAGHIFVTDCKKGVPPKGLPFLQEICKAVNVPVYAIGGVNEKNIKDCEKAGASGVCIMSGFMKK